MKKIKFMLLMVNLLLLSVSYAEGSDEELRKEKNKELNKSWGIKDNFKTWGIITGISSSYRESQDNDFIVFPFIDHPIFEYQGYQRNFYVNDMLYLSPSLTYSDNYSVNGNDLHGKYKNLDDRRGSIEAGIAANITLDCALFNNLNTGLRLDTGNSYEGSRAYFTFEGMKMVENFPIIMYDLTFNAYSEEFMDYYFGVSEEEASKLGIEKYEPENCASIKGNLSLIFNIKENTAFILSGGIEKLGKEFKSDIIETTTITELAAILIWTPN